MKPTCFVNANTYKYNLVKHVRFHYTLRINIII
jgi:hypothetical protein